MGLRSLVPEHEHYIIDEQMYHAMQDLWTAAAIWLDTDGSYGELMLENAVQKLDTASSVASDHRARDAHHHVKESQTRGFRSLDERANARAASRALRQFADGVRTTEVLFRDRTGAEVTYNDLLRSTATAIEKRAGAA